MSQQKKDPSINDLFGQILNSNDPDTRAQISSELASHPDLNPDKIWKVAESHYTSSGGTSDEESQIATVNKTINRRYATDIGDIACPNTLAELLDLVNDTAAKKMHLRAVGSCRSLSDAPEPEDNTVMVNTGGFAGTYPIDKTLLNDPRQGDWLYTCGAGRTVEEVLGDLDPNPQNPADAMAKTLQNMGAGHFQTIVGALSTSTHGSGVTQPSFPQLVAGLELVTVNAGGKAVAKRIEPTHGMTKVSVWLSKPENDNIELVQDDNAFNAALVSVGSMGVIYKVTLKLVPGFYLKELREVMWWSDVKANLDTYLKDNDYFELVLDPLPSTGPSGALDHQVLISMRNKVAGYEPNAGRRISMKLATTELGRIASALLLEWELRNPSVRVPNSLTNAVKASRSKEKDGQYEPYIDKNYKVLQLDMDINADSSEQNVAVEQAVDSIDAMLAYYQKNLTAFEERFPSNNSGKGSTPFHDDPEGLIEALIAHPLPTSPLGVRFVPANEAFMSPMYKRVTCTIETPMAGSDFLDHKTKQDESEPTQMQRVYKAYLAGRRRVFHDIEALLVKVATARPHWGQANYLTKEEVNELMPGFAPWMNEYQVFNAYGTFNGAFTKRLSIDQNVSSGSHPVVNKTGKAIFRHQRSANRGILKIKGDLAWLIFNNMTTPIGTKCKGRKGKKCKKMGVSLVASTANIVDPVVCEMRFSDTGELMTRTKDYKLYHALSANRQYGQCSFDGTFLTVTGDAATGFVAFVNAGRLVEGLNPIPNGPIVFRLLDMATGMWRIESD